MLGVDRGGEETVVGRGEMEAGRKEANWREEGTERKTGDEGEDDRSLCGISCNERAGVCHVTAPSANK